MLCLIVSEVQTKAYGNHFQNEKNDVTIDPICINIRKLERTEPNLMHFKWGSPVKGHSVFF